MRRMKEATYKYKQLVYKKLVNCLLRGYIQFTKRNQIKSYINYFSVPKGTQDIRMAFDGASCGTDKVLFASNF